MSARVEVYRETVPESWRSKPAVVHSNVSVTVSGGLTEYVPPHLGKWRWRFVSNGRVMADSGQGYSRRIDCLNGCATVLGGRFNQPQWIADFGGVVTNGVIGYIYRHRAGGELDDWATFAIPERDAITVRDLTREAKS